MLASEIPQPEMQSCDYLSKTGKFTSRLRFKNIHLKSVFAILSKLKNGKASGMSMIPDKILKSAKDIISESLTDIVNASLESNTFPDDLKVAGVIPIFKNGERNDLQNYRPVSVLCAVARVLEKLIYQQLCDYLMENSILNNTCRSLVTTGYPTLNWNSSDHIFVIDYSAAVSMVTLLHLRRSVEGFPRTLFWVLSFSYILMTSHCVLKMAMLPRTRMTQRLQTVSVQLKI